MIDVGDVAKYILKKSGQMTTMKLQKLCYYSQAWSLVWDERPLFRNEIQAWANGPVCPDLYNQHRGEFKIDSEGIADGDENNLDDVAKETIDAVLDFYGGKSGWELSHLTHSEAPWKDARGNLPDGERSNVEITQAAMAEYYGSLTD